MMIKRTDLNKFLKLPLKTNLMYLNSYKNVSVMDRDLGDLVQNSFRLFL